MTWTLRHSRWQDVDLTGVVAGRRFSVICDPPYSDRTHRGRRTGSEVRKSQIEYASLPDDEPREFVAAFVGAGLVPQFWAIFGDDVTAQIWKNVLADAGQYTFATVPWVKLDAAPRMDGQGPSSAVEHITVASGDPPDDPVHWITVAKWRHHPARKFSRPGYYLEPTASTRGEPGRPARAGRKPLGLMRRLVRDYSEPGDLIIDPYCGTGPTLVVAETEERDSFGCDIDAAALATAEADLRVVTPGAAWTGQQIKLFS